MDKNKANKILKALTDLYNANDITEDDFYTLSNDNKLIATLWCLIDTNLALDPINPRRTIIQSLSSVAQQHYKDINTDLVNKLNSKDYSTSLDTLIKLLDNLNTTFSNKSISINNLNDLINIVLTVKLQDNTFKLDTTSITNLVNNLRDNVLNTKLDSTTLTSLLNLFKDVIYTTKLDLSTINAIKDLLSTTLVTNRIEENTLNSLVNKLTATTLTTKLDNKVEITNLKPTPIIINEDEIINSGSTVSREVSNYSVVTYQVVTTAILGTASLSLQGSLDNINWCNLPITYCSGINVVNNIVSVNSNGSTTLSINAITKYVRLNIVGSNTKNTVKLYLK